MTQLMKVRLALAVIGIAVWGYAIRVDDPQVRLAGIAVLALALVLRFADRRRHTDEPPAS